MSVYFTNKYDLNTFHHRTPKKLIQWQQAKAGDYVRAESTVNWDIANVTISFVTILLYGNIYRTIV